MVETETSNLLTIRQVADRMSVSRQTVYTWINSGKIKTIRTPGGRKRIPEDQLVVSELEAQQSKTSNHYIIWNISRLEPIWTEWTGTKEKNWFAREEDYWYWDCNENKFLLFKAGREGTGENWAEKIDSELCDLMGLPHAEYELAIYRDKKGVITPSFVAEGNTLVLGNELLQYVLKNYDGKMRYKQRKHTLTNVYTIFKDNEIYLPIGWLGFDGIETAGDVFIGYLMLDAWIGNQDRHHENWGLVLDGREKKLHLAPTFDHASSLARNESDKNREDRLLTSDQDRRIENFVQKARSAFYSKQTDNKTLYTIDAFMEAARAGERAASVWLELLRGIRPLDITRVIDKVPKEEMSDISKEFTQKMLEINRKRLLALEL